MVRSLRYSFALSLALALAVLPSARARACVCEGDSGSAFDVPSNTVYEAEVVRVESDPDALGTPIVLRVVGVYRGPAPSEHVRLTIDTETSCSIGWEPVVGDVVFAAGEHPEAACSGALVPKRLWPERFASLRSEFGAGDAIRPAGGCGRCDAREPATTPWPLGALLGALLFMRCVAGRAGTATLEHTQSGELGPDLTRDGKPALERHRR